MMYDETNQEDGATDETIADFTMFHDTYLSPKAPGQSGYSDVRRPAGDFYFSPRGAHRLGQSAGRGEQVGHSALAH